MLLHQLTIRSLGFFILNLNSIFKLTLIMLMKSVFCCAWICLALLLLLFEYCNTCTRPLLEKEVMNIQITFDVSFYELQQVSACLSQNRSLQNIRRICLPIDCTLITAVITRHCSFSLFSFHSHSCPKVISFVKRCLA